MNAKAPPDYIQEYLEANMVRGRKVKAYDAGGGWWKFDNIHSKFRKSRIIEKTEEIRRGK